MFELSRRSVTLLLVAAALLPLETKAASPRLHRETGYIDSASNTFVWTGGGLDPLQKTPRQALDLPQVRAVMPLEVANALLQEMERVRRGPSNYTVEDGSREDVMLSGKDGWIANNVVAMPSQWQRGSSRRAWVVYAFDTTGAQWRMTYYEVCRNIAFTRIGAPVQCVCVPARGDGC